MLFDSQLRVLSLEKLFDRCALVIQERVNDLIVKIEGHFLGIFFSLLRLFFGLLCIARRVAALLALHHSSEGLGRGLDKALRERVSKLLLLALQLLLDLRVEVLQALTVDVGVTADEVNGILDGLNLKHLALSLLSLLRHVLE